MIDLSRARSALLADIASPDPPGSFLQDITDPRVATMDVSGRICRHEGNQLLSLLKDVLLERFAAVPRAQLLRDLLIPLKHALGNAHKHGNASDASKAIAVEIVLTAEGALIAVTDEGPGFDATRTFRKFQDRESYFEHYGTGFRNLDDHIDRRGDLRAGRTLLLCYRPAKPVKLARGARCEPPSELADCYRVYAGDECGRRYVLTDGRILTGRAQPTEAQAEAEFAAATELHGANFSTSLHIPKPVARLAGERRIVLYDFDPLMNLEEYFTHLGKPSLIRRCCHWIARALARLHRCQVVVPGAGVPMHGGLGWDCIQYCVDGRFYLYRFETRRQSDPGLDLGGFAADLLGFLVASQDEAAYRICYDIFLNSYNERAERPMDAGDLRYYTELAVRDRLRQPQLLRALDVALSGSHSGIEAST